MTVRIITGDCRQVLRTLPDESVHCVVTSPPYWGLRDYRVGGQMGRETCLGDHVDGMVEVFAEVRRVLRKDGTLWLNYGDSYAASVNGRAAGHLKPKDLCGIPWRVAFALQADGWYLRQDIIWSKLDPIPESVRDRCTKAHEYIFLLSKSGMYYFDQDAIAEPAVCAGEVRALGKKSLSVGQANGANVPKSGNALADTMTIKSTRNKRSVWEVATSHFGEVHFATFPPALIEPCILAGCPVGGTVLDPFGGAGTTGLVAERLGRNAILIELNPQYAEMAERRIREDAPLFADCRNLDGGEDDAAGIDRAAAQA